MNAWKIYHVMTDRFYPVNNKAEGRCFKGGNIRGIIEKLDYIQSKGMEGIMLTPFYKTNEYHGYHITDYAEADPHFGTWDDIRELVREVHNRNMIIVADFVPNHCHKSNPLYADGKYDDWFLKDKNGKVKGFANLSELPAFDTDNKSVQTFFIKQGIKLCQIGFDAIRMDHATGPTYHFWEVFRNALKAQYPDVLLIGEVWGKLDFKPRNPFRFYWNKLWHSAQEARQLEYVGVLDGVFDFRYQELVCHAIKSGKHLFGNAKIEHQIKKHFARYPKEFQLWLFLDNHDMNRFLFECKGDESLLQEAIRFTKKQGKTFLMYYGTEKSMMNEKDIHSVPFGDEMVREPMDWD